MIAVAVRALVGLTVAITGLGVVGAVTAATADSSGHARARAVHLQATSDNGTPTVNEKDPSATPDVTTTTSPAPKPDETVDATEPPSGDGATTEEARSTRGTTLAYILAAILAVIGAVGLALARWR